MRSCIWADDSRRLFNKGKALYEQGKYDAAIQASDKVLQLNPNYADAWNIKGSALASQDKYDETIQAFDKTIEIDLVQQRLCSL